MITARVHKLWPARPFNGNGARILLGLIVLAAAGAHVGSVPDFD